MLMASIIKTITTKTTPIPALAGSDSELLEVRPITGVGEVVGRTEVRETESKTEGEGWGEGLRREEEEEEVAEIREDKNVSEGTRESEDRTEGKDELFVRCNDELIVRYKEDELFVRYKEDELIVRYKEDDDESEIAYDWVESKNK